MKIRIPIKAAVLLGAALIIVVWFAARSGGGRGARTIQEPSATNGTIPDAGIVEFDVTARQFSFEPNPIRVKLGDRVKLNITSVDVTHGFALPDFGVSAVLNPGETTTVEFIADRRGRFSFYCSVVCGAGHAGMRGNVIVE